MTVLTWAAMMLANGWGICNMKYHVILADECGDEFSVEIEASSRDDAWDTVQMDYPESGVVAVMETSGRWKEARNRTFNEMWED
jgi:hypothetical protein